MKNLTKLKIGNISYTNTWPVSHFFNKEKFKEEVEFVPQVPSQLNQQMAEGRIDLGPISSFSYAEHSDEYLILPNLSVSAYGNVGSISLFLKDDLDIIKDKKIALSNTSATSVNLLKIILEGFLGGKPDYTTMPPQLNIMMETADAALLIGDEAIIAGWKNNKTKQYRMIDLGAEWLRRTNQWMTFAVWAVRMEVVQKKPGLLYRIYQEFLRSKERGKKEIKVIITETIKRFGGSQSFWQGYFAGLSHDFDERQIRGLKHYFKLAKDINLLSSVPEIKVIDFKKLTDNLLYKI